jgi:hypothetical protein
MSSPKGNIPDHVEYSPGKDDDIVPLASQMPTCLVNLTSEEREKMEKKLVRKIDTRLLVMIVVMYILNYLDRNNIASAKLAGLEEDLGLKGEQYQVRLLLVSSTRDRRKLTSSRHRSASCLLDTFSCKVTILV